MNTSRFFAILFVVAALGSAPLTTSALANGQAGNGGGGHSDGGGGHFGGGDPLGGGGDHLGGGSFGGHFGGGHFGHDHFGGRFFSPLFGNDDSWDYYYGNGEGCWQYERVSTPRGWQWRQVWVCN
jgi:hypothetical protein